MSRQTEFSDLLAKRPLGARVVADEQQAKQVADYLSGSSWPPVRRDYQEVDVTTLGDAKERIEWANTLVGTITLVVDSGEYEKPHRGGWLALP